MNTAIPAFHDSPFAHMTPDQRLALIDSARRHADTLRRDALRELAQRLWRALAPKSRRTTLRAA